VAALLQAAGLPVHAVDEGGLDHGIWTPLRYMYPDADVPVLPLAFRPTWSPAPVCAGPGAGAAGRRGRADHGSGSITHNLRRVFRPRTQL
jgi:4,5-DOPA dioxygenase extradiol